MTAASHTVSVPTTRLLTVRLHIDLLLTASMFCRRTR